MFKRWIERIKTGCREFVGAMTKPGGLRKMKGYEQWWQPVATVPEEFENQSLRNAGPKWRYQEWEQGRFGRWKPVYNYLSLQSAMEIEL